MTSSPVVSVVGVLIVNPSGLLFHILSNTISSLAQITSSMLVAQHCRSMFCNNEWNIEYADIKINQVVVTYLKDDQVIRPPAPPIVSPCKDIMSCFSILFLGLPWHSSRWTYSFCCKACSRGRGVGSNSCGANLMVQGCTCTNQTFWTEDQFVLTVSSGIRDHDRRVAEIVSRELEKTKPGKWGYVQVHELGHRRRRLTSVMDNTG
jgi:hypothetical protein